MSKKIDELVAGEPELLPESLRPFFSPLYGLREDTSVGFRLEDLAHAYRCSFSLVAEHVLQHGEQANSHFMPMVFLARHSMEMHLRWAIDQYDSGLSNEGRAMFEHEPRPPKLTTLWSLLVRMVDYVSRHIGVPSHELYARQCLARLKWISETDPKAIQFLYPDVLEDHDFALTRAETEELIKIHWHVSAYATASSEYLSDVRFKMTGLLPPKPYRD